MNNGNATRCGVRWLYIRHKLLLMKSHRAVATIKNDSINHAIDYVTAAEYERHGEPQKIAHRICEVRQSHKYFRLVSSCVLWEKTTQDSREGAERERAREKAPSHRCQI